MKGVRVMAFCLLLSLVMMSLTEAKDHIRRPIKRPRPYYHLNRPRPYYRRHYYAVRDVAQAEGGEANKGWLKRKWDDFSEKVHDGIKSAETAVREFWEKVLHE
ncbi:hypothetical protein RRG08_009541 [Elysia crispata]|uniref:Uncharacterized protein n=1 Tax=Elysia crispata TaxID=231223 RepID=A0AAE1B1Q5_9GAST|nr:hypothetical protein RRG08_009541 [Elysia crispata]